MYLRFFIFLSCSLLFTLNTYAQNLKVAYNASVGISKISYKEKVILDVYKNIGQPFRAEGYKIIKRGGETVFSYSHLRKKHWDNANKKITFQYDWGSYSCQYIQKGDSLYFNIQMVNTHPSDTFAGVGTRLVTTALGELPSNFKQGVHYNGNNIQSPAIVKAVCKNFQMVVENPDARNYAYAGLVSYGKNFGYSIATGNRPIGGITSFDQASELRLAPGKTAAMTLVVKFVKPGTSIEVVNAKLINDYRRERPQLIRWQDKRPIGSLFLASYSRDGKEKGNPRNWVFSPSFQKGKGEQKFIDFKKDLINYADRSISILKKMGAQGMITWDIEGQEFPHAITYIGAPELIEKMAPEMNKVIDDYFRRFSDAGFRTGICIRPDSVIINVKSGKVYHVAVKDPAYTLIRKIRYAQKRWGSTLFYVDSNVEPNGGPMPARIFEQVARACPDVLVMPEHITLEYYRFTAPYREMRSNIFLVNEAVKSIYPDAFLVLNTADGINRKRMTDEALLELLKRSKEQGNIFLFRAWYGDQPIQDYIMRTMGNKTNQKDGNR